MTDLKELKKQVNEQIRMRLKEAREAAGYPSAMSAAKENNWCTSTYSAHENGSAMIRPYWLPYYAAAFGVNKEWLRTGVADDSVINLINVKHPARNRMYRKPITEVSLKTENQISTVMVSKSHMRMVVNATVPVEVGSKIASMIFGVVSVDNEPA